MRNVPSLAASALWLALAVPAAAGAYDYGHTRADLDLLTQRVDRLERILRNQSLASMVLRIQQLEEEVQRLRGDLETQGHELEALRTRQRRLYLDLDRRLGGEAPPAKDGETTAAAAPNEAPATSAPPKPAGRRLRALYERALKRLKQGDYEPATADFEAILAHHPDSDLADNAQYWLAEAAYVQRDFATAEAGFRNLLQRYPTSPKVPGALLKLGYIQYERRTWRQARKTLERLLKAYPQSTEAHLARQRLERMRREHH